MSHQRDRATLLTKQERRLIFRSMHRAHPISWLLRALSLAAMGFLLSIGTAAAHDDHGPSRGQTELSSPVAPAVMSSDDKMGFIDWNGGVAAVSLKQANAAKHDGTPCSSDQGDGKHATGCCCTMACHAALATLTLGPLTDHDRPSLLLLGIFETLRGRSGDRTERPPKFV
ncbi:MAG: hypothetical protein A3D94_07105 [Alphaproteobacteria bacterium RIFCSPHIGHO2_12_FULL_66_14]|nr:MAG: hypothetical protein A3D94_07105 [Alphaproteobacteria bacterium RIFCSPHIGHO2_12_FULL_66_14]